jgi:RES domain-containing protein
MRAIWRLCSARFAASALDGEGARRFGGRWNEKGTAMVYCWSTLALAMLEILVHASALPASYVAIRIEIPASVTIDCWQTSSLPVGWQAHPAPPELARRGSAWVKGGAAVALDVPSAIVSVERNILLNPAHPDMAKLVVDPPMPLPFDARLK